MMNWRQYHEATKHSAESLKRAEYVLDWANIPDPFRHYEGVPVLDLPADTPDLATPALDILGGAFGSTTATDGATFLSQILFYSASISASKRVPSTGYRYALRVNPSSGNLHPTEFHFLIGEFMGWPAGMYHYRPSSHMAEQRAACGSSSSRIIFALTSIVWREAWKYRDRAYRYCLHDVGHAWEALTLAARAIGYDSFAVGDFSDDEVAQLLRLNEDEWPMLLIELRDAKLGGEHARESTLDAARQRAGCEPNWNGGQANQLSQHMVPYPQINAIHGTTKRDGPATCNSNVADQRNRSGRVEIKLPESATSLRPFGEVARTRRSALDFVGGMHSMSLPQLFTMLTLALRPISADFTGKGFIQLYLYVHRVAGLDPGVYRVVHDRAASTEQVGLEQLHRGDQRVMAAGLSLGQDLAGNACVAISMIGDLEGATRVHGDRGYRYVHFEAGVIGQRLYLAAHALGLGATGIGAFFDDEVNRYLQLSSEQGQVIYHFAIGYPVPDPRLQA